MKHLGKMKPAKVDCEEVRLRYPVEPYKDQKDKKTGVYKGKQSHHVIQNAHFQFPRGTTVKSICANYEENDAPCIPLSDGTNTRTEHGRVSKMQKAAAKEYRARDANPTYEEARQDAKDQLMATPKPGLSDAEAECILVKVDEYFDKACPSMGALRKPGSRSAKKSRVGRKTK